MSRISFLDIPRTGTVRAVLVCGWLRSAVRTCMRRENHPDLAHVYSSVAAARRNHPDVEIPTTMPVAVVVSDMNPAVLRERVEAAQSDDDFVRWCAERRVLRERESEASREAEGRERLDSRRETCYNKSTNEQGGMKA